MRHFFVGAVGEPGSSLEHRLVADRVAHPPAGGRGDGPRAPDVAAGVGLPRSGGRASGRLRRARWATGDGRRSWRRASGWREAPNPAPGQRAVLVRGRGAREGPRRAAGCPVAHHGRGTSVFARGAFLWCKRDFGVFASSCLILSSFRAPEAQEQAGKQSRAGADICNAGLRSEAALALEERRYFGRIGRPAANIIVDARENRPVGSKLISRYNHLG